MQSNHHVLWAARVADLRPTPARIFAKMSPVLGQQIHNCHGISPRDPYRSIVHKQIYILGKVRASKSIRTTKKAPDPLAISVRLAYPRINKISQIEGFEPWDTSHEKERANVCQKLKSRASETVSASSYGQINVLEPETLIMIEVLLKSKSVVLLKE